MRLRKEKKGNPFEASMPMDNPDIKIVSASYKKKPILFGVGTSRQREIKGSGEGGMKGIKAKYQSQKDVDWQLFYNLDALKGFVPAEKLKDFITSTVAVTSGSMTVYSGNTKFIETDPVMLEEAKVKDPLEVLLGTGEKGERKRKKGSHRVKLA